MFEVILLIIGSACFGVIWKDHITPLNEFKEYIGLGFERKLKSECKMIDYHYKLLHKVFNCVCISFWITLILTGSILYGCISYIMASLIYQQLNKITLQ